MTFFKLDSYDAKEEFGAKWLKIFYHNSTGINFFTKEEAPYNVNDPAKYSILKLIPRIRRYDSSVFEFLIEFPELEGFNRWTQIANPLNVKSPIEDIGFSPISLTWNGSIFAGIARSSYVDNAFMDCCANSSTYWHYAIGAFSKWGEADQMPGPRVGLPDDPHAYHINVREVQLFIRVKEFHHLFNHFLTCNHPRIKTFLPCVYILFIWYDNKNTI